MPFKILIFSIAILVSLFGKAQKKYVVNYALVDGLLQKEDVPSLETNFSNQIACASYLNKLQNYLLAKGFISASLDSIKYTIDTAFVSLYLGKNYKWIKLDVQANESDVLLQSGWSSALFKNNLSFNKLNAIQTKMLDYYQENGYPFAKIKLDSIVINGDSISGKLITDKGFLHKIDSIRNFGTVKISSNFLQKYLNIKNGSLYKKSTLDNISKKLTQLPYLQQQYPINYTMLPSSSIVNLYLTSRKSSIVNVLLGIIPVPNPNGLAQVPSNKVFLSGDANILLNNSLGVGETIGLTYQQLSINSRRINMLYKHPYIFNSNYGLDAAFEIYKRDSSYLNFDANIGVMYNLGDNKSGKVFFQYLRTTTFPDTSVVKFTKRLPDNLDIKSANIGFLYDVNTTDYRRNPLKGNELNLLVAFGTKKVFTNSIITTLTDNTFNYAKLYDTIKKNTYQFRVKGYAAHYFKLRKQSVLKTALNGGMLLSQNYFRNELFQIGGFKLLRGFDEESQFCKSYAVITGEYRYLIGSDSYFFAFADGGYANNPLINNTNHTYFGTGLGLNFATKSGLFNVSFALGTRDDIPLSFKQAKLHFGYVNVF